MKKIVFGFLVLTLCSCKKSNEEPQPPEIEFVTWNHLQKDANGHDLLVELVINFKDKNGDIGRIDEEKVDKCGRQVYDLFIYYERKINGTYVPEYWSRPDSALDANCVTIPGSYVSTTQIFFHRSIDYIQPEGNNRSIEGEIAYKLDYNADLSNLVIPSTGRCRIFLVDRARNKSNEIYSGDLDLQ